MSDDRMDRAERIRNMREGNRGTDEETESDATGGDSQPSSTDGGSGGSEDTGFSSLTEGDDATAEDDGVASEHSSTEPDTSPTDATPSTAEEATASASQAPKAAESQTGGVNGTTDSSAGTEASSDAQAAAKRAAESAAEVMGGAGTETAPDTLTEAESNAETGQTGGDGPAVPAGATGASTVPGDISGVELPDQELLEEAMATSSVESTEGGARAAMEGESTQSEETVRVLEFSLGDEYYCLDIEYVEEIVKRDTVTRVPNTPAFVDGVVDLRGQITTILEPKEMMDIDSEGEQNLIIVFDPEQFEDQGAIGWVVDEVRQVVPVPESDINTPPVDAEYINGVVDRDEYDQFVIWVEPEDALAQATATEEE